MNGTYVNGGYVNGGYANDGAYDDGAYADGVYQDDSSPPAWPSLGAVGYGQPRSYADEPSTGAGSIADDPSREWYSQDRPFSQDRDHHAGPGHDPDLWIEATVWASVLGSGVAPAAEVPDAGADDWTLPLPVVRAAPVPEPDPVRPEPVRPEPVRPAHGAPDPVAAPPRSRRARRAAEERAVGSQGPMPQPGTPQRWRSERRPDERSRSEWADSGWEAAGMEARGEPDRGAHATDRSRHGGHRAVEPGDDATGRAARRHASAHGRHSDDRDDPADRPRHRRPEH
ncbi:MAG TPA: hypothetical protein VFY38_10655 [Pseudonocardia sp.]|nr:hypothetical protein [Pseudonocardia sp.]